MPGDDARGSVRRGGATFSLFLEVALSFEARSAAEIRGTNSGGGRDWSREEKVDLVGLGSAERV